MAAPRAYWKGYLKLSLVTCPVAMYPASSQSEKTRFHQINRKTGNRLRQQMVNKRRGAWSKETTRAAVTNGAKTKWGVSWRAAPPRADRGAGCRWR